MSQDRKAAWQANFERIKEVYPDVNFDWNKSLGFESDVFVDLLSDVIKAEGKRSKPGKRPSLSRQVAESELARLSGEDYSEYEFQKAFQILTRGKSVRGIAHKVGIDKSQVHRLLTGAAKPSFEAMEKIAAAYKKHPSFFVEYRTYIVLMLIEQFMKGSPETATAWYVALKRRFFRS